MKAIYLTYGDILGNVFESQMEPLWRALASNGIDLSVMSFLGPSVLFSPSLSERLRDRASKAPVRIRTRYTGAGFPPRWPGLLKRQIRMMIARERPEVIHARGPLAAGLTAEAIAGLAGLRPRLLYDVRGDTLSEMAEGGWVFGDLSQAVEETREFEADALKCATALLCVSSPLRDLMKSRYGFQGPTEVIPCWGAPPVDWREVTQKRREEARKALAIPTDVFVWCYCGSVARWQAVSETLQLLVRRHTENPAEFVLLVTDDVPGMTEACRKVGLSDTWVRIRSGKRDEAIRWMNGADAGILLRQENAINRVACPIKFADYLLAGLPVLATQNIGDVSAWVREYGAGTIATSMEAGDLDRAATELRKVVAESGRGEMSKRTSSLFRERLALERFLPVYLRAYGGGES
jgi:hypothetical protein